MSGTIQLKDAIRLSEPLSLSVMIKPVGSACPLSCRYCYYEGAPRGVMPHEVLERIITQTISSCDGPVAVFNWHGGEPLLAGLDFYREAVRLQKLVAGGKIIENTIQTSGLPVTEAWARFFSEESFLVGLSIDGPEEVHDKNRRSSSGNGSFLPAVRAMALLLGHGVRVNTLTTINHASAGKGHEVYRFLKGIGSHYMQFLPVADPQRPENISADEFGSFMCEVYDDWLASDIGTYFVNLFDSTLAAWCGLPRGLCTSSETCGGIISFDVHGNAYICDHFEKEPFLLGNIMTEDIRSMVEKPQYLKFCLRKRDTLPSECQGCNFLFACWGECPGHRDKSGKSLLCEGYKHFFTHTRDTMLQMSRLIAAGRPASDILNAPVGRERSMGIMFELNL